MSVEIRPVNPDTDDIYLARLWSVACENGSSDSVYYFSQVDAQWGLARPQRTVMPTSALAGRTRARGQRRERG